MTSDRFTKNFSLFLLFLHQGWQPVIKQHFVNKNVSSISIVYIGEVFKLILCVFMLYVNGELIQEIKNLSIKNSIQTSALPALVYAVQNVMIQYVANLVDGMTFNCLLQIKILFHVLFIFFLLGKIQSKMQIFSLFILILSSGLLTYKDSESLVQKSYEQYHYGCFILLLCSILIGTASSLTEYALQGVYKRNAFVFTIEMCIYSFFYLSIGYFFSQNSNNFKNDNMQSDQFLEGWDYQSILYCFYCSLGGIITSFSFKYNGGVKNAYSSLLALVKIVIFQRLFYGVPFTYQQFGGFFILMISLTIYRSFPSQTYQKLDYSQEKKI